MTATLPDPAIVVTGGFGALGAASGEVLVQAGARVALIGRGAAAGRPSTGRWR